MSLQRGVVSALVLAFVALPATAQLFPSRSTEPRIPLIESADAPINLIKVMANHPDLMAAWPSQLDRRCAPPPAHIPWSYSSNTPV